MDLVLSRKKILLNLPRFRSFWEIPLLILCFFILPPRCQHDIIGLLLAKNYFNYVPPWLQLSLLIGALPVTTQALPCICTLVCLFPQAFCFQPLPSFLLFLNQTVQFCGWIGKTVPSNVCKYKCHVCTLAKKGMMQHFDARQTSYIK